MVFSSSIWLKVRPWGGDVGGVNFRQALASPNIRRFMVSVSVLTPFLLAGSWSGRAVSSGESVLTTRIVVGVVVSVVGPAKLGG